MIFAGRFGDGIGSRRLGRGSGPRLNSADDLVLLDGRFDDFVSGEVGLELAVGNGLDRDLTKQFLPRPEGDEHDHEINEQPSYLGIEFSGNL